MILLTVDIGHFGKLKNRQIRLRPGINVITGNNESGKTTIAAFIEGMLFGIDPDSDAYRHYYPYDFEGVFGGRLEVLDSGVTYEITRSFLKGASFLKVCNLTDQREIEDPERWIRTATAGITAAQYEALGFMSQTTFLNDFARWEETEEKEAAYASERAVRRKCYYAREALLAKREALKSGIDPALRGKHQLLEERIADAERSLRSLTDSEKILLDNLENAEQNYGSELKKADAKKRLQEDKLLGSLNEKKKTLAEDMEYAGRLKNRKNAVGILFLILGLLLLACDIYYIQTNDIAVTQFLSGLSEQKVMIAAAAAGVSIVFLIISVITFVVHHRKKKTIETVSDEIADLEEEIRREEAEYLAYQKEQEAQTAALMNGGIRAEHIRSLKSRLEIQRAQQAEEKKRISEAKEEKKKIEKSVEAQTDLQNEILALDEAIRIFESICNIGGIEKEDRLSALAGEFLARMDADKEDAVTISGTGVLTLANSGRQLPVRDLSASAAQEVFLSVRLAAFNEEDPDRKLPLILDDALTNFDSEKLGNTVTLLRSVGRQVLLMSCQNREMQTL